MRHAYERKCVSGWRGNNSTSSSSIKSVVRMESISVIHHVLFLSQAIIYYEAESDSESVKNTSKKQRVVHMSRPTIVSP